MDIIKVLDASLRDGGHRTNFHFNDKDLEEILKLLDQSGLEYIEIGYRNGSLHPIENLGRAGLCEKEYLLFCRSLIKNAKIAVMAHPENVKKRDLEELKACGITLLRICIAKGQVESAYPVLSWAKELDLETSANLIHMSYYKENELDQAVEVLSCHNPNMIYFADSNGSMLPSRIQAIYKKYTKQYPIPFGFHAHDNLGLAQANALAALSHGAQYIDVSLAGMGKGIGNLKTEFFIAYLHAIDIKKYKLPEILAAANYVRSALGIGHEGIEMDEFIRGISDFSTADLKIYKETL
ncbi:4-hydroxy-2-oxovalerate aldolase [Legionella micdadei]|uniref:Homocitrate synthase n=1 Tax=Legionella micdadei TaxID=451 RepID=A0A098GKI9_LEGMI|nr:4-hydroxy-2-oxovalerate aldolase [Legionella micdadei]ARG96593.1 4-hydroxy-2-oxovalerate aldolase [Legionella micdadei]ARG99343.1 4-hydroxy-2-oxovalerate aldolase [Legionella micdadei]KTD27332.1 4-hydroxy-2-oxovalerate aldolase [Legionella micdadei]CEG62041.1 4-hydroxy-2-oxovalerate aldolase [Legionella micdadei]SCY76036.1 4-hydroxy 2-oxovalerate aldolase [Legionella micdadei]